MTKESSFSRRDFLNLSAIGMLGWMKPARNSLRTFFEQQQGRVIYDKIAIHQRPSFNSTELRLRCPPSPFRTWLRGCGPRGPVPARASD